tara:strand:+ start:1327 stop:1536 length:210 start_codon:yes stop_codon:yes gene_type:complete
MTPKQFSILIDDKVKQKSITHMDAVLEYCEEKNLESDQINHLISRSLKEKIRVDAEAVNLMPKSSTLPV